MIVTIAAFVSLFLIALLVGYFIGVHACRITDLLYQRREEDESL